MTHLEATVELMRIWATFGLSKNRTPDELRGDAISLYLGLQGSELNGRKSRSRKGVPEGTQVVDTPEAKNGASAWD